MKLTIEKAHDMIDKHGDLNLYGTGITSLPDNLTVGGRLDLYGTGITSLPDNLTVGGWLDLEGTGITNSHCKKLQNGDYVPGQYLYADNILTHVKRKRTVRGYTLYVGKIPGVNVVSDGKNYAHCRTIRDGIADLIFKEAKDRGAEKYKGLTLDSALKTEKVIAMYRTITGACQQGTARFIESMGKLKNEYTVREVIEITKGQYGADRFADFFNK